MGSLGIMLAEVTDVTTMTPFKILQDWSLGMDSSDASVARNDFIETLGLPQLGYSLTVLAVWVGILSIFAGLILLSIVKYPKTVAQVKTKTAAIVIGLVLVAAGPYLCDVVVGIISELIMFK